MQGLESNLKKTVEKIRNIKRRNEYCEILLKVHEGKIRTIETKLKEKL